MKHAKGVITDPSDITARPETVELGTNELLGTDPAHLGPAVDCLFAGQRKQCSAPPLWDIQTGARIVAHLERLLT
ncbi:hypothetical protein [Arenimonas daejeonensis]|uniref:hypothetical protein n=1 Tax=Arenimonas daejeonensis TaxID=370777 RepID=UPI001D14C022|nr:hypothetical protein [Arenimonas daejeonensis]